MTNGTLKFAKFAVVFKPLMMMYFGAGVFLNMLWDLVFEHTETILTATLWSIFLLSVLLSVTHYLCYTEGVLNSVSQKAKMILHLAANYLLVICCVFGFRWAHVLDFKMLLIVTGEFAAIYAILFFAFYWYYKILGVQLNEKLEHYKKS